MRGEGDRRAIGHVLDDFHRAAADADEARYFGHFTPDAVFLGTDPTERWDLSEFQTFAHPYFARGHAWAYQPLSRNVVVSGDMATFDEALHSDKYGLCRGTGALRRVGGQWKVAQYSLSFPIPNGLAPKVVPMLMGTASSNAPQSVAPAAPNQ
jgi:ketosteroid isomerase-like protein